MGALLALAVAGCAGFRGGWQSVAYVGEVPPAVAAADEAGSATARPPLALPGLTLEVTLDNQLRTYDNQVMLFVVPMSVDPREAYPKNNVPGKTRVFVTVTAADDSFVFRPAAAQLGFAGKQVAGAAGFEFGMWDQDGKRVKSGGSWQHRPLGDSFALAEPGRRYYLSIDFDTPVPSPELKDITIDLSAALQSPRHPKLPLIRFAPVRWKEGYT